MHLNFQSFLVFSPSFCFQVPNHILHYHSIFICVCFTLFHLFTFIFFHLYICLSYPSFFICLFSNLSVFLYLYSFFLCSFCTFPSISEILKCCPYSSLCVSFRLWNAGAVSLTFLSILSRFLSLSSTFSSVSLVQSCFLYLFSQGFRNTTMPSWWFYFRLVYPSPGML